jgi:hypothetical protein
MENQKHNYVVYHLHSDISSAITNIDSINKPEHYVDYAQSLGMTAMAFSEHGSVLGWKHKKDIIEKAGMKYIHACEFYLTEDDIKEDKHRNNYHCVLIAKNYDGVKELNLLSSQSFNRDDWHFYYMPRISVRDLYNTSDKIHLKSGKHEIIYVGNSPEVPYLPLAFISGDFAFLGDALIPVPKKANDESLKEIFKGFSGTLNFSFRTEIPDVKNPCISFNPYGLYAKIYIDGELIGEKAWAPYIWQIPKHFIQKDVEIKISLTTSIAPLFGTYDVLKSVSDNIPSGKHHQIGLSDVYILSSD